jgi:membrane-bound lytic murein transglycosylase A
VTPLGAPVFISGQREGTDATLNRLVVAQDVGGAIRGAVRADLFWGRGGQAGNQALQTRDRLSMWVLLPRSLAAMGSQQSRTRGVQSARVDAGETAEIEADAGVERLPDCVIDDGVHCSD